MKLYALVTTDGRFAGFDMATGFYLTPISNMAACWKTREEAAASIYQFEQLADDLMPTLIKD
jgi:hypothetical protein